LDSAGKVTVVNKDLSNDDHGIIFVLKKQSNYSPVRKMFLLAKADGFQSVEPADSVHTFLRQKNLEPSNLLLTLSDK
jgi:hypothetical protein